MAVFDEHAPDVWNMCRGFEVNSSRVVCAIAPRALRGPPCVLTNNSEEQWAMFQSIVHDDVTLECF